MALRWDDAHDGSPWSTGYDGDRLAAQVVRYDTVGGGAAGWVGYVLGERVTGRCTDMATAQGAVERELGADGSARDPHDGSDAGRADGSAPAPGDDGSAQVLHDG